MITEEWRDIVDFPYYQISNLGRINSTKRYPGGKAIKQYIQRKSKVGYFRVCIVDDAGNSKNKRVNRMVLEAFVGPAPTDKHVSAHVDGNSLNNWLMNLRWSTRKENEADKEIHGTKLIGITVANAKLNPAAVRRIRKVKKWDAKTKRKFMVDLGVSRSAINDVLSGRTWSHIT